MKKIIQITLIGMFILLNFSVQAQDQNLIKRTSKNLSNLKGLKLAKAYNTLAYHYAFLNLDSTRKYVDLAIEWGKANNNLEVEYMAKMAMGKGIKNRIHLDSGIVYLQNLKTECEELHLYRPLSYTLIELHKALRMELEMEDTSSIPTQALAAIRKTDDSVGVALALTEYVRWNSEQLGEFDKSVELILYARDLAEHAHDSLVWTYANTAYGGLYGYSDHSNSKEILLQSLNVSKKIGFVDNLASVFMSIAVQYAWQGNFDTAIYYQELSDSISDSYTNNYDKKVSLNNLSAFKFYLGDTVGAINTLYKAFKTENIGRRNDNRQILGNLGELHTYLKQYDSARYYLDTALSLFEVYPSIRLEHELVRQYLILTKAEGNFEEALYWQERKQSLADSLSKIDNLKALQRAEKDYAKEKSQLKKDKVQRERTFILAASILVLVLVLGGLFSRFTYIQKSKATIEKEKDRSENLLHNILPKEVAEELKEKGASEAKDFDEVTVLFSDFKEFTQTAKKLSAKELVSEINACFKAFDAIMQKYQIEKIKTIGDAYMAAGGLHEPRTSEPKDVVLAGLEMQAFMLSRKAEREAQGLPCFDMRVGIHTGPVVAGIVGVKKFQYDIWGDTVNTASRMESHGAIGKVNVSNSTYEILKDYAEFNFESRGKSEVKGLGETEMWFVSRV
jgi:class 3 adenylate cyclase